MFDGLDPNFKRTMQGWYKNNIFPVFEQAKNSIISLGEQDRLIPEFGYWWASYIKNSMILLELMLVDKYSNQSAFSMRILMEIAADVLFISKNKNNIDVFRKYYINNPKHIKNCSYKDFTKISKKLILRDDKTHKEVKTIKRIRSAFGKDGQAYYEYLCNYTHLNYLGVIKDIDASIENNNEMDYRLEFIKYYPDTFIVMIRAAENLSGDNSLSDKIDTKQLSTAISDLVTKHSLGIVE